MLDMRLNLVERAFELARSGDARTITDIQKTLSREGYANVAAQLSGKSIRDDLRRHMRTAAIAA